MHYKKSDTVMFVGGVMQNMKKMKSELYELRYFLEQNVAHRTEHLMQRIAFLESCNATLCDQLDSARNALAALRLEEKTAEPGDHAMKLYAINTKPMLPVVIENKSVERAAA